MKSLVFSFILIAAFAAASPAPVVPDESVALDRDVKKVVDIFAIAEQNAADPVDPNAAFYQGAIPGMLRRLDPHSVFFDPGQFEQLKQMEQSTQKGFGSVVSLLPGRVIVLQTMPNTPSARSGMMPGDEIVAINNIALSRLDIDQLVQLLTETRQQKAQLQIRRQGSARLLQFELVPENMEQPSVDRAFLLQPGIGYVRVTGFEEKTAKLLREAIEKLGGNQLKGLVLDLRNNPGGVVGTAFETASMFLEPKQKVLSIRGRATKGEQIEARAEAQPYHFPVSIIMNGKSASASEIVAGALQDHDRAIIVGEPSFGKGLVQSVYPLSNGTGLALTTAFYYTPSGRSIQRHLQGQLEEATQKLRDESSKEFKTDKGRVIKEGQNGGIQPDELVYPSTPTRLRAVLDATGAFPNFATEYLQKVGKIPQNFDVTPALLDDFKVAMAQRSIQPSVAEWSTERNWIYYRLKEEILNQAFGVERGDEVEAQYDPQVQAALAAVTGK